MTKRVFSTISKNTSLKKIEKNLNALLNDLNEDENVFNALNFQ